MIQHWIVVHKFDIVIIVHVVLGILENDNLTFNLYFTFVVFLLTRYVVIHVLKWNRQMWKNSFLL